MAHRMNRHPARVFPAILIAALAGLAGAPAAAASTTIGQLAPGSSPPVSCISGPQDLVQPTVTSGNSYVVPSGGVAITSWSTNAAATPGQMFEMKIFRKVAEPSTYQVVGHDGPHPLTPAVVNTFPANIAVQPGDVLGVNDVNAGTASNACAFFAPGDQIPQRAGDLADGASGAFTLIGANARINATAVVGFKPSNAFSFGKVKRNKRKGTATLATNVPGPGTLTLKGKGVKAQRRGRAPRAIASKTVSAAGKVKLKIVPKGKTRRKLNDTGKAKVKVKVTFTPNGTATGDVIGDPNTQSKRIKLIKRV
jgi:hypothetical protein